MGPLLPRAGLNRVHRFVGLSAVGGKRCVPLSLKPVPFGTFPADLVKKTEKVSEVLFSDSQKEPRKKTNEEA
ncbi:MAG: hypothetical protein Q6352_016515 [Candidatus Freyrarchaeum guaymaensis]